MTARKLLAQSQLLMASGNIANAPIGWRFFSNGGRWMQGRMQEIDQNIPVINLPNFAFYGIFKYALSVSISSMAAITFYQINPVLCLLAVLAFYLVEVQFLFLFPIIIDGRKKPLYTSLKATQVIGTLRAVKVILPIGIYMLLGLFNFKSPLKSWHVGCLAVILWYHEIRDRL